MSFARTAFVAIDYLFDAPQNNRRCTRFKNVEFVVDKDIVYDKSAPEDCTLDTYYVKRKEGKYPVLFYIHGGGFVAGDKKYRRALSRWSAQMGYFVINVDSISTSTASLFRATAQADTIPQCLPASATRNPCRKDWA